MRPARFRFILEFGGANLGDGEKSIGYAAGGTIKLRAIIDCFRCFMRNVFGEPATFWAYNRSEKSYIFQHFHFLLHLSAQREPRLKDVSRAIRRRPASVARSLGHRAPPNGVRYLLAGGLGFALRAGFRLGVGKSLKMPQNPASQVHAVLGCQELFMRYQQASYLVVL